MTHRKLTKSKFPSDCCSLSRCLKYLLNFKYKVISISQENGAVLLCLDWENLFACYAK